MSEKAPDQSHTTPVISDGIGTNVFRGRSSYGPKTVRVGAKPGEDLVSRADAMREKELERKAQAALEFERDHPTSEATRDQGRETIDPSSLPQRVFPGRRYPRVIRVGGIGPVPGESEGEIPPAGRVEAPAKPGERMLGQLVLPGVQADLQSRSSGQPGSRVE